MNSFRSNSTNQTRENYYHALANVIGIFGQFHEDRIRRGLPFATTLEGGKIVRFSPQRSLDQSRAIGLHTVRPITDFEDSVFFTMAHSFEQFLEGNGFRAQQGHLLPYVQVPEPTKRFFAPFVHDNINEAIRLDREVHPIQQGKLYDKSEEESVIDRFGDRMRRGIKTGIDVPTQLRLLFGDEFRHTIAVTLSKINIVHLEEARQRIGIKSELSHRDPSFTLLDNSVLGLDMSQLQEWGLGNTLGCPAGMKVTPETQSDLARLGCDVSNTTMLRDFAMKLPDRVDEYLGNWFRGLTREDRAYIAPEEIGVLTGNARKRALEAREGGCPYGKER